MNNDNPPGEYRILITVPLVGEQEASVYGCSSGLADGLAQHPQGRENLDP
jgi:hypothetical protein